LKACLIKPKNKRRLFNVLSNTEKFGVVITQDKIRKEIFSNKKSKQRYLDFAYKIAIKKKLEELIEKGVIIPSEVENIYFYVDEHLTATDGKYELRENLEQELKYGTFNWNYNIYYPALFPDMNSLKLDFCSSEKVTLIRSADIIANRILFEKRNDNVISLIDDKFHIIKLPSAV
jgi:hypothetical protein